jgi:transposase-like protein
LPKKNAFYVSEKKDWTASAQLALELIKQGKSVSAVAKTFNVHPATIYRCLETRQGN